MQKPVRVTLEPVDRRRGRPPSDASHAIPEERVLSLAFQTFAQHGYEGTTLRGLAKQLGVSHNLLHVRFRTKANLWRRALDAEVARVEGPVYEAFDERGLDAEARLRQFVHRFCRWALENPQLVGITNVECRHASWRLDHIVDAYMLRYKKRLDELLRAVARLRPVRSLSSMALMSILVQGVGFYFAARPLLERIGAADEIAPAHVDAQVERFAQFVLAALLPPDGGGSPRPRGP